MEGGRMEAGVWRLSQDKQWLRSCEHTKSDMYISYQDMQESFQLHDLPENRHCSLRKKSICF
jgi:hypothetical protein